MRVFHFIVWRTLQDQKPIRYFGNAKDHKKVSAFDQTFAVNEGYCQKLKRDDQQHTQVSQSISTFNR